jgi:hypothetical protein
MKTILRRIAAIVVLGFASILVINTDYTAGLEPKSRKLDVNFEHYRAAIKHAYEIDIADFKDKIPGGMADGKPITNYDLGQLLEGIKYERMHTSDSMLALEIAKDHLEHIPDYYSRVMIIERDYTSDKLLNM